MLQNYLCEIGLTTCESKVYLELLKIGSQPVSVIANRLHLRRTSLYSVLNTLMSKGLVLNVTKNNISYYSANDPNSLIAFIDEKSRTYEFYRNQTLSVIPKFRSLIDNYSFSKPMVSHCEGYQAVSRLLADVSTKEREIFSYFPVKTFLSKSFLNYLNDLDLKLKGLSYCKFKMIAPDLPEVKNVLSQFKSLNSKENKTIFVPITIASKFQSFVNIYSDTVIIATFDSGSEFAIKIKSPEVSSLHLSLFDFVWDSFK